MLAERLGKDACYRTMFARAFPGGRGAISMDEVSRSLAAFERTLVSFGSPYDAYVAGDRQAITARAEHGATLFFGRLDCASCHAWPMFTDAAGAKDPSAAFHDIGLYGKASYPAADQGLGEITGKAEDVGRFRTPSLRNVALTGPYMHDGSVASLTDAIRRHRLEKVAKASDQDVADVVAFLKDLSDPRLVTDPAFSLPKTRCGKRR